MSKNKAKFKKFFVHRDHTDQYDVLYANKNVVYEKLQGNDYVKLTKKENYYLYEWKHGLGKGSIKIPCHVMFDLPTFLSILHKVEKHKSISHTVIYDAEAATELFK